jgi:hypothetical protein
MISSSVLLVLLAPASGRLNPLKAESGALLLLLSAP